MEQLSWNHLPWILFSQMSHRDKSVWVFRRFAPCTRVVSGAPYDLRKRKCSPFNPSIGIKLRFFIFLYIRRYTINCTYMIYNRFSICVYKKVNAVPIRLSEYIHFYQEVNCGSAVGATMYARKRKLSQFTQTM